MATAHPVDVGTDGSLGQLAADDRAGPQAGEVEGPVVEVAPVETTRARLSKGWNGTLHGASSGSA